MSRRTLAAACAAVALLLPAGAAAAAAGAEPPRLDGGLQTALLALGFGLVVAALLWLPEAFRAAWRRLRSLPRAVQVGLAATVVGAAIVRLFLAPKLVITMYMGYMMTERAATLVDIPRYGVGSQTLWHALFLLFPRDHVTVIAFNCLLGTITLVWLAAALARAGFRPLGILAATLLAAFVPLFIWSDSSDSLTVPVLFWTVGALVMAQEHLDTRRLTPLAGAVLWLALAGHTRPEHVVFGPALVLAILVAQRAVSPDAPARLRDRLRLPSWKAAAVAVAGYVALVLPQILHALFQRSRMLQMDSWPREFGQVLPDLPGLLVSQNALLDPSLVPLALLPLAGLGLLVAPDWPARRLRLTLLLFGLAWLSFFYIDLSPASLPRLHVVGALPVALVAGAFLGDLALWRPRRLALAGPALALAGLAAVGVGAPATAAELWQPTNEREEEALYRDAVRAIPPDEPYVLVRRGWGDEDDPKDHTHLHAADYLFAPPESSGTVVSIGDFLATGPDQRPTYFLLSMRCFSKFRPQSEPPPLTWFASSCQRLLDRYDLEPVVERVAVNRGDIALRYYSQDPYFLIGLYRVHLPKGREALRAASGVTGELAIPPGQEALLGRMLGEGAALPAGCTLDTATVDRSFVRAQYVCEGGAAVEIELHPASAAVQARQTTASFAIVADGPDTPREALVGAVTALVRAGEGRFQWKSVNRPSGVGVDPLSVQQSFAGTIDELAPAEPVTEFGRQVARVEELYVADRNVEALELALALAREDPTHPGLLGLVVANIASTQPTRARVDELVAAADAAPDDMLAQFLAGVGAHYCAHYLARTPEEKRELYALSLRYLERTRPAFDFEPRVYIYLAVSHFRLGHQERAEQLIEQAVHLDRQDADAYYCRAEIFQRKEPQRSLRDLRRYLASAAQPTGVVKPGKVRRVQNMYARLVKRMSGELDDLELWDPLEDQGVVGAVPPTPQR
jgi:tetratricopeptide (TPR) repeat protein